MRLKTFHAKTMSSVMDLVRTELGPDAIIIQIDESKSGVRVTAALEANATPPPPSAPPEPKQTPLAYEVSHPIPKAKDFDTADISAVLNHHDIPFETASRISDAARAINGGGLIDAFAGALETTLRFSPITDLVSRPIMLVGPPGAGKTICAAKLTADAVLHERQVNLISADTVKAAGIQQLDHYAQLMKQTVATAATPEELASVVRGADTSASLTVIDMPGVNPFDMEELKSTLAFIQKVDAEPVLVMPAGLDALDAQEIAGVFSKMGCQRFIATRLDAARRYSSVIMAARPGFLSLAAFSRSPYIADGLDPATPMALSKLVTALPARRKTINPMENS
ncbi:MAG: hypothetical protein HWE25_00330 [Alphaproteobacteria bacterium]|nr:hypothetical protein [Alphaproteobacteria bacterium]